MPNIRLMRTALLRDEGPICGNRLPGGGGQIRSLIVYPPCAIHLSTLVRRSAAPPGRKVTDHQTARIMSAVDSSRLTSAYDGVLFEPGGSYMAGIGKRPIAQEHCHPCRGRTDTQSAKQIPGRLQRDPYSVLHRSLGQHSVLRSCRTLFSAVDMRHLARRCCITNRRSGGQFRFPFRALGPSRWTLSRKGCHDLTGQYKIPGRKQYHMTDIMVPSMARLGAYHTLAVARLLTSGSFPHVLLGLITTLFGTVNQWPSKLTS